MKLAVRVALALVALLASCGPSEPVGESTFADGGRVILDVRTPDLFAAGHAPGAVNIQLGWSQLDDRAEAYVPDKGTPIAIVARSTREAERAAGVLAELGYRDVTHLVDAPATATLETWTTADLEAALVGDAPPTVIDVRTASEFAGGVIDGAITVDQDRAPELLATLPRDGDYVVICEIGWRSSQLASLMRREGFPNVVNAIEGMAGWRGRPAAEDD